LTTVKKDKQPPLAPSARSIENHASIGKAISEASTALGASLGKVTISRGRLETRPAKNDLAEELAQYMAALRMRIDMDVYQELVALAQRHRNVMVTQEKAVDVMLSVDLVLMGHRGEYDAAYLLTADGDYTPAVAAVREVGKRVYCASPTTGAQLAAAANTFIPLKQSFFADCMY
jgi:uncharacterized LabA/DUF88 family protein